MEMEGFKENPSEIHSFPAMNVISLMKKRKFHEEQLDLPTPKHRCWVSMFDENLEIKNMQKQTLKRKIDGTSLDDRSKPESGGGSNSFTRDSDYATSVYGNSCWKLNSFWSRGSKTARNFQAWLLSASKKKEE